MSKIDHGDPYPQLPRRGLFRDVSNHAVECGSCVIGLSTAGATEAEETKPAPEEEKATDGPVRGAPRAEDREEALPVGDLLKKRGRPTKGEPWKALGISRRTYYRKKAGMLPNA